jgi:hypothetical protein
MDADSWICVIGRLSENLWDPVAFLKPLLAETPAARGNLCSVIAVNAGSIRKKHRLFSTFWADAPQSAARVLEWLSTEPRALDTARENARRSAELYGTFLGADL